MLIEKVKIDGNRLLTTTHEALITASYGGKIPYSAAMRKNPRIPSTHSSSST